MSEPAPPTAPAVVDLVPAGSSADHGLAGLGLLMQLAGRAGAAAAVFAACAEVFGAHLRHGGWVLALCAFALLRARAHRRAGKALAYARKGDPLAATDRYVLVALAQAALTGAVLYGDLRVDARPTLGIVLALAAWPLALRFALAGPRFQRFRAGIPIAEDKGFEGAAILMTVLGLAGAATAASLFLVLMERPVLPLHELASSLLMISFAMLIVRSALHVQAGLSGLRETAPDRAVDVATRYASFGVLSAGLIVAVPLLAAIRPPIDPVTVSLLGAACWALLAWPLIVRRYFSERQFADLMLGPRAAVHRRAPDRGLATLGWLLLGHAALVVGALAIAMASTHAGPARLLDLVRFAAPFGTASLWWTAGATVLEVGAALALIRMAPHARAAATLYAAAALAVLAMAYVPVLRDVHALERQLGWARALLLIVPIAAHAAVPAVTLLLVNRRHAPQARARFRVRT